MNSLYLLALIFTLTVGTLRHPKENTCMSDAILNLSFLALVIGTLIFVWAEMNRPVSITLTIGVGMLTVMYMVCTDPNPDSNCDSGEIIIHVSPSPLRFLLIIPI